MNKRHSSRSASSSSSVSTISTNLSNTHIGHRSRPQSDTYAETPGQSQMYVELGKRRRSESSSSVSSISSRDTSGSVAGHDRRNVRRKRRSRSPEQRGRRRSRSPGMRGHEREGDRTSSREQSRDRRQRHSLTRDRRENHRRYRNEEGSWGHPKGYPPANRPLRASPPSRHPYTIRSMDDHRHDERRRRPSSQHRKDRSLSPFSKRLALTQAMNEIASLSNVE